jgi:hypothetical protein
LELRPETVTKDSEVAILAEVEALDDTDIQGVLVVMSLNEWEVSAMPVELIVLVVILYVDSSVTYSLSVVLIVSGVTDDTSVLIVVDINTGVGDNVVTGLSEVPVVSIVIMTVAKEVFIDSAVLSYFIVVSDC